MFHNFICFIKSYLRTVLKGKKTVQEGETKRGSFGGDSGLNPTPMIHWLGFLSVYIGPTLNWCPIHSPPIGGLIAIC